MPLFQTNLLVRDNRLPQFEALGCRVTWHTLNDTDFQKELQRKLLEEAGEAVTAQNNTELAKELADVLEILQNLAKNAGVEWSQIEGTRLQRLAQLGGFEKRIFTSTLEAPEGSETCTYHRQYPEKYPEVQS